MEEGAQGKQIHITDFDLKRLNKLIMDARTTNSRDNRHLKELESELGKAVVVGSKEIPLDVITMNSTVVMEDLDTGDEMTLTLCFPADADVDEGKISVLAPVGTAMIGYSKGDVIEWPVPAGMRRLRVKELLYQPESSGDYDL